jgi:NADPH:quinone reductase-like Zn-dependent oxidoreductase
LIGVSGSLFFFMAFALTSLPEIQDSGFYVKDYPFILGTDVAGEVAEVGSAVKDFKKGDRVLGYVADVS